MSEIALSEKLLYVTRHYAQQPAGRGKLSLKMTGIAAVDSPLRFCKLLQTGHE
ncbi:MAG: hypothetical protein RLN94_12600 [Roseovarius sp.]